MDPVKKKTNNPRRGRSWRPSGKDVAFVLVALVLAVVCFLLMVRNSSAAEYGKKEAQTFTEYDKQRLCVYCSEQCPTTMSRPSTCIPVPCTAVPCTSVPCKQQPCKECPECPQPVETADCPKPDPDCCNALASPREVPTFYRWTFGAGGQVLDYRDEFWEGWEVGLGYHFGRAGRHSLYLDAGLLDLDEIETFDCRDKGWTRMCEGSVDGQPRTYRLGYRLGLGKVER